MSVCVCVCAKECIYSHILAYRVVSVLTSLPFSILCSKSRDCSNLKRGGIGVSDLCIWVCLYGIWKRRREEIYTYVCVCVCKYHLLTQISRGKYIYIYITTHSLTHSPLPHLTSINGNFL